MLDLYINVKNSLGGLMQALQISISNANNFNTPGYKYTVSSFTTVYSEAMTSGTALTNPMQTGSSITLGATTTDFSQGSLTIGTALDAAIAGEGFFIMSKTPTEFAAGAGAVVYTRAGRFQTDFENKYIVDAFGRKVFGFKVDGSGNQVGSELVPLETNGETDIGFLEGGILASNFSVSKVNAGETPVPMYKLALTTVQNKNGLVPTTGGAYVETVASGDRLGIGTAGMSIAVDSSGVYGEIIGENLEGANVDIARVALDMNLIQRGINATQGIIDNIKKIIDGLISATKG